LIAFERRTPDYMGGAFVAAAPCLAGKGRLQGGDLPEAPGGGWYFSAKEPAPLDQGDI
jgi:hypothetical protein